MPGRILSILALLVLIVSLPWITIVYFIVWLVIGLAIYFLNTVSVEATCNQGCCKIGKKMDDGLD